MYEADNHLFFPGTGPADYQAPQHVGPVPVDDITTWIDGRP